MTGFNHSKQNNIGNTPNMTPIGDKKNIIGIKPYLGGKRNLKSPNRELGSNLFNSVNNMEDADNKYHTEREIQEEIGVLEDTVETHK